MRQRPQQVQLLDNYYASKGGPVQAVYSCLYITGRLGLTETLQQVSTKARVLSVMETESNPKTLITFGDELGLSSRSGRTTSRCSPRGVTAARASAIVPRHDCNSVSS